MLNAENLGWRMFENANIQQNIIVVPIGVYLYFTGEQKFYNGTLIQTSWIYELQVLFGFNIFMHDHHNVHQVLLLIQDLR